MLSNVLMKFLLAQKMSLKCRGGCSPGCAGMSPLVGLVAVGFE